MGGYAVHQQSSRFAFENTTRIAQLERVEAAESNEIVAIAPTEGIAALKLARGESAALRNLSNSACLAADNPPVPQLRLLQRLAASTGNTVVTGVSPLGVGVLLSLLPR